MSEKNERSLYLPARLGKFSIVKTNPNSPDKSSGLAIHFSFAGDIGDFEGIAPVIVWQFAGSTGEKNKNGNILLTWNSKSGFWFRSLFSLQELRHKMQKILNGIKVVEKDKSKIEQVSEKIKDEASFTNPGANKYVFFGISEYKGKIYVNMSFIHKNAEVNSNVKINLTSDEFLYLYNTIVQFIDNYFLIAATIMPKMYYLNNSNKQQQQQKSYNKGKSNDIEDISVEEENINIDDDISIEDDDIKLDISEEDLM